MRNYATKLTELLSLTNWLINHTLSALLRLSNHLSPPGLKVKLDVYAHTRILTYFSKLCYSPKTINHLQQPNHSIAMVKENCKMIKRQ